MSLRLSVPLLWDSTGILPDDCALASLSPWDMASLARLDADEEGKRRHKELLALHGLYAASLPHHVALIMNDNNRWAQQEGLSPEQGYETGAIAWHRTVKLSARWGVSALNAFIFSTENWCRAQVLRLHHIHVLLMRRFLCKLWNIQACAVGEISKLPASLQLTIKKLERRTAENDGLKLSIAINYGRSDNLVQVCRSIATDVRDGKLHACDIKEEVVDMALLTRWMGEGAHNPDLVIRTSGDQRISNFLLWQCAYPELLFLDFLWPEMDELRYAQALLLYQNRKRRFGGRTPHTHNKTSLRHTINIVKTRCFSHLLQVNRYASFIILDEDTLCRITNLVDDVNVANGHQGLRRVLAHGDLDISTPIDDEASKPNDDERLGEEAQRPIEEMRNKVELNKAKEGTDKMAGTNEKSHTRVP
ncbi:hypothetical protein L7F22_061721 [Adiantum nelumboides]|nr:hypothetical protein [Adiantum nelumboides]